MLNNKLFLAGDLLKNGNTKFSIFAEKTAMAAKSRKKRAVKAQKSPLMLVLLIVILLAIVSVVVAYFILPTFQTNEKNPGETTTETVDTAEEEPIITIEPMYAGTWVSNYDGAMLTIDRYSFTLEMPSVDQKTEIKGELSVVKNVLTFVYTSGSANCRGEEGHYQYTLEENGDIFFKLIKDNCISRKERMQMSWFRL